MMKKVITAFILALGFLGTTQTFGQQQVMFTQYMFNQLALNPAYAGIHEGISTSFLWREQWVGFEGAPQTQTFSIHSPINFRPIALGAMVIRDQIGITTQNGVYLSYAYRIRLGNTKLSFGLQSSFTHYQSNYNLDGILDPTLLNADVRVTKPNFGGGVLWHSDKFYVGVSSPQLMNQQFDRNNPDSDSELVRHYFVTGGYLFPIHENILLKPNFLLKAVEGAPVQADININVLLQRVLWVGLSYRSMDSFDALLQVQVGPKLQVGYAFDFATTTDLKRVNAGSHEFMLNYIIELPRTKILTPRYF